MRVAIIAYGHADNVICLARALSDQADVQVIFVTSGSRFTSSILDWDLTGLPFGTVTDASRSDGFMRGSVKRFLGPRPRVLVFRTPSRKVLKDWTRRNYACIKRAAGYVADQGPDVVHFNGSSGFQVYFHMLLSSTPKVLTIHDYEPHTGESSLPRRFISRAFNRFYVSRGYEFIQHYAYLTDRFSNTYNVKRDRVHTVRCGPLDIYRAFAAEGTSEEPGTILFFGRISPYKGLEYLIRAFQTVRKELPRARLTIAGAGQAGFLDRDTPGLDLLNYHVPNDELARLIQRSSVVVAPYTDATHSAVIMTAYAFRKPVIASAVGGIPEVVADGGTGRLVPPRDSGALARAIIEMLRDDRGRQVMKANIARRCSKDDLSWRNIARETLGVYRTAMNTGRA